jgi:hypothetical protein
VQEFVKKAMKEEGNAREVKVKLLEGVVVEKS